ncbi:MAG: cobalt ECF transporter T component CbiQ [Methanomicrobiales archaeon]|nr:cobalt ECF transporter T component CbiQ [Methanomicrobiales archaeon]
MIEDLFALEKHAYLESPIHRLDARVKIISVLAVIIGIVAVPYTTGVYAAALLLSLFFIVLWGLSRIPPRVYARRLAFIVPVWGTIILVQVFLKNPYYPVFHPVFALPFGIFMYRESIEFATILGAKFLVSVSFIILLSTTTTLQDILKGASRLGLPAEFALTLGMMVRYLYVFGYMYRKVVEALHTRCFDPLDPSLPYGYRLRELGYTVGSLFVRSYEQGERVYTSMCCRGYGRHSHLFVEKRPFTGRDWAFLSTSLALVAASLVIGFIGA